MKKFCKNCGDELWGNHRKFCSTQCRWRFNARSKPNTIANNFPLFKNIVAASTTAQEFNEYWLEYFKVKAN